MSELRRIMTVLNDLEREFDLFSLTVDEAPIWDYIRPEVWKRLNQVTNRDDTAERSDREWDFVGLLGAAGVNSIERNPLLAEDSEVLFHGFNRRILLETDTWWCPHCDPIVNEIEDDWVYLESPRVQSKHLRNGEFHSKPPETDSVYYTDCFSLAGPAIEFVGVGSVLQKHLSPEVPVELLETEERIASAFGTRIDIEDLLWEAYVSRKIELPAYTAVLDRIEPEVVVTVNRSSKLPFVEACHRKGIPTIELQQGAIHEYHPGYSYPISTQLPTIPDFYFTFGDFWNDVVELPIPDSNIVAVGWPYIESEATKYDTEGDRGYVTVLSQPMVGEELARFAVGVAKHLDGSREVVFRPHPNVGSQALERYPILSDSAVTIGDPDQPLYELFSRSIAQIGVSSTALFEGLRFDLRTFVVNYATSEYTEELVRDGFAQNVDSPGEVASAIESESNKNGQTNSYRVIFEDDAIEKTLDNIESVRRWASGGRD